MAWVRWSSPGKPHDYDSLVYVMDHVDGDMECVNCQRGPMLEYVVGAPANTYRCWTREEMAEHMQWHIDSGDPVPDFVIPSLLGRGPRWVDTTMMERDLAIGRVDELRREVDELLERQCPHECEHCYREGSN